MAGNDTAPALAGIHHVKLAVGDLDAALAFFAAALGARRIPAFDHRRRGDGSLYAYICEVPGLGAMMELRLNPARAAKHRGFDPITIAVADRAALDAWVAHLDAAGLAHSPVIASIQAWLIAFDDPDGNRLRLYTLETHGPEIEAEEDNPWVKD